MRLLPVTLLLALAGSSLASGVESPQLQPLIARANSHLTLGQYTDAARLYSEAIDLSPLDYLLYYKRATAYFSMSRHSAALDDFEKVTELTKGSFDKAEMMKVRVHLREGNWDGARAAVAKYKKGHTWKSGKPNVLKDVEDLEKDLSDGEKSERKMEKERAAQLWTACVDSATTALRAASHSIEIRSVRAECELASGDIEGAVGDLT
jgi:DnaJ homolog subfamily C member 3